MKTVAKLSLPLGLLLLGAGCPQTAPAEDMSTEDEDLRRPRGDMAPDLRTRCELPSDYRLIDQVSDGMVTITPMGGTPLVYGAVVDASAGGSGASQSRPYVYLDLVGAKKVSITDMQARDSKEWDIGLKRATIKINSGDSGPGGVTGAEVQGKELGDVATAPGGAYVEDDYLDSACKENADPILGLKTVLFGWFDYNVNTHVLTPYKNTYVLKRRDGMGSVKLQIMSYYDPMSPMRGGVYTLRWSFLP